MVLNKARHALEVESGLPAWCGLLAGSGLIGNCGG
jgi:hypothetical protein